MNQSVKTPSKHMWLTQSAGKRENGFDFFSDWMKKWREVFKPMAKRYDEKPKKVRITFDTRLTATHVTEDFKRILVNYRFVCFLSLQS